MHKRLTLSIAAASIAALSLLTGCSAETSTTATSAAISATQNVTGSDTTQGPAVPSTEQTQEVTIIDVRTPEEFASGHLDGAVNINLEDPGFQANIDALDKNGTYEVYCRSGNRSAQAATIMTNSGFTNVTDLGGIDSAATTTGIDIVS